MGVIKILNEDCMITMDKMKKVNMKCDLILTSPPYNTSRGGNSENGRKNHECRYDIPLDEMTNEEYITWTIDLFNKFDGILSKNGCILYNLSYGSENTDIVWLTIAEIIKNTNFKTADCIVWKKNSALPNNVSSNKLTRIIEYVFVFCRKEEFKTFNCNKKVKSKSKTGQNYFENIFNYIEAKNNDGSCDLNKATYSSELCLKLLDIYANDKTNVYDPFSGTGTTALSCKIKNLNFIGSELSKQQCEYSFERLNKN